MTSTPKGKSKHSLLRVLFRCCHKLGFVVLQKLRNDFGWSTDGDIEAANRYRCYFWLKWIIWGWIVDLFLDDRKHCIIVSSCAECSSGT